MPSFKVISALLASACLVSVEAFKKHECQHDHHQATQEKGILRHNEIEGVEDLQFDRTFTLINQGGRWSIKGGKPGEFEKYFTIGPDGKPKLREVPLRPNVPLKMASPNGSPFRIVLDFSTLKINSQRHVDYIQKQLMPAVADYFKSALRVKYPRKEKITVQDYSNLNTMCDGGIPRSYVTQGVEGDLVILVKADNVPNESWAARAGSCEEDEETGRTIVASVKFNLAHIDIDDSINNPFEHEGDLYTTMHEITHVLGFSFNLYPKFLLPDGRPNNNAVKKLKVGNKEITALDVEPLTSRLKKHFGCDQIYGAPLENQGGSGSLNSHFERRVFLNEYMTASEVYDGRISEFSLAFLEGTGWFIADYTKAEPYHVGAGEGCAYLYGHCENSQGVPMYPEYCPDQGKLLCSQTYQGAAICSRVDQFSDGCGVRQVQEDFDCRSQLAKSKARFIPDSQAFGANVNSRCFMGDLLPPNQRLSGKVNYCFTYKCNGTGSTKTLDVIVGKSVGKCTRKGSVSVAGYSGTLECPDPVEFCKVADEKFCRRGCMGRGTCDSNGKCQCNKGFKGEDCSMTA